MKQPIERSDDEFYLNGPNFRHFWYSLTFLCTVTVNLNYVNFNLFWNQAENYINNFPSFLKRTGIPVDSKTVGKLFIQLNFVFEEKQLCVVSNKIYLPFPHRSSDLSMQFIVKLWLAVDICSAMIVMYEHVTSTANYANRTTIRVV